MGIFSALFGKEKLTPLRRLNERIEGYEMKIAHLKRMIKTNPVKKDLYEAQIQDLKAELSYLKRDRSRVLAKER